MDVRHDDSKIPLRPRNHDPARGFFFRNASGAERFLLDDFILWGVFLRMPWKRVWTDEEIAKLRSLAGKISIKDIAAELGRTPRAIAVEACKLGLSLRCSGPRLNGRHHESDVRQ